MIQIGRRIYYELLTGNIILDTGERAGSVVETTIEQDFESFSSLSERVTSTVGVLQLEYGQFAEDFARAIGYRVNVDMGILEFNFSTPNPDEPETPPVFEKSLSTQVAELKEKLLTATERYQQIDKLTATLDDLKIAKLAQLEEMCDISIVGGFDFTINEISYRFSCSLSAQANFQGSDTLFKDGLITEAEWTAINNVTGSIARIIIDQDTFSQIKLQVFIHINSNISKLRNTLQPLVESSLSNAEVDSIDW